MGKQITGIKRRSEYEPITRDQYIRNKMNEYYMNMNGKQASQNEVELAFQYYSMSYDNGSAFEGETEEEELPETY